MVGLISRLKAYMHDVLAISVSAVAWKGADKLPFFLREQYQFFHIKILSTSCLVMIADDELTPATVFKQWQAVNEHWPKGDVIYVAGACSAYNRKRLIEHKVPFIVPGNQMYLPMLGIDLREHFKKVHTQTRECLSPAAQLLAIMAIKHKQVHGKSPSELARLLEYSAMSMTRSARELESLDLVRIDKTGRKQQVLFNHQGKELWLAARKKMISPVRKRIWIKSVPVHWPGIWAGESALAKQSMIGEPKYPVYALASSEWASIRSKMGIEELTHPEPGCAQLELWRYGPERLAKQGCVDCFSLWLSSQDSMDERIETALEEMMEATQWQ